MSKLKHSGQDNLTGKALKKHLANKDPIMAMDDKAIAKHVKGAMKTPKATEELLIKLMTMVVNK